MRLHDDGVIVIGAGVAGLAAAGHLRAAGVPVTLIEAGARIGGRAATGTAGGTVFDLGATWLHDAERNPLVALAGPGDALLNSDDTRRERLTVAGRKASAEEHADYGDAWEALDDAVSPALAGPDTTLAAAMTPLRNDHRLAPWADLVALWEGAIIAAADADALSLRDWHANRLDGTNLVPADGVGAYVARKLATEARTGVRATRVRWAGPGVAVETDAGTVRGVAAIVTVSTGVLRASGLPFDPPLPPEIEEAFHALPMGLLTKVALVGIDTGTWGVEPNTTMVDARGRASFQVRPQDRPYVVGFLGGRLAWEGAKDIRAQDDLLRIELRRMLGSGISLGWTASVQAHWGTDPLFLGAYSYAGPGDAGARGVLAGATLAERVVFAGEATRTDGLAGTVGGAFLSGVEAADRLLAGE